MKRLTTLILALNLLAACSHTGSNSIANDYDFSYSPATATYTSIADY